MSFTKKEFVWDEEKNKFLKKTRNISFEEIVVAFENTDFLDKIPNSSKNHPDQMCAIVEYKNYFYVVPFIETEESVFLKTIFPSRKYKKKYGKKDENI